MGSAVDGDGDRDGSARRPYDSPIRRARAAATRQRILDAGSALVHEFPVWDWSALTFRAVAERAGVGERTVYRHFPTERQLHDAVMQQLEDEAGVSYVGMTLDSMPEVAARVFASLGSFAASRGTTVAEAGTSFAAEDDRRRTAVRAAVDDAAPEWNPAERDAVAAALDAVWGLPSYERLVTAWAMDPEQASAVIGWLVELIAGAIEADDRPPVPTAARRSARGTSRSEPRGRRR